MVKIEGLDFTDRKGNVVGDDNIQKAVKLVCRRFNGGMGLQSKGGDGWRTHTLGIGGSAIVGSKEGVYWSVWKRVEGSMKSR